MKFLEYFSLSPQISFVNGAKGVCSFNFMFTFKWGIFHEKYVHWVNLKTHKHWNFLGLQTHKWPESSKDISLFPFFSWILTFPEFCTSQKSKSNQTFKKSFFSNFYWKQSQNRSESTLSPILRPVFLSLQLFLNSAFVSRLTKHAQTPNQWFFWKVAQY